MPASPRRSRAGGCSSPTTTRPANACAGRERHRESRAAAGHAFGNRAWPASACCSYLLLALRKRLRERGRLPSPEPDLPALLDLVAVGTVADLDAAGAALLVSAGLRRLRTGAEVTPAVDRAGAGHRDIATLSAGDINWTHRAIGSTTAVGSSEADG